MITCLAIENNNLNIYSDPWIKSDRESIRNSCDVLDMIASSAHRVAKCHLFYTEQIFQTKFYPVKKHKKSQQIQIDGYCKGEKKKEPHQNW